MLPENIQIHADPAVLLQAFLRKGQYTKVAVLTDSHTARVCLPLVKDVLEDHLLIEVPAGEEQKNLDTCTAVWKKMTEYRLDRHSLLVVLGGGVLGDLGGFCAATFKRGIDFALIPTTLLAQVDASIGGKLGIDFMGYKNHIGVFREPVATLISQAFLKTLPDRELRSGFAEVIKHCIISDADRWKAVSSRGLDDQDWAGLITHSVRFKSSVVASDPRESGLRKILNFGHTIGHALESYFLGSGDRLLHGEAIAAGMIAETYIASRKKLVSEEEFTQVAAYLSSVFGQPPVPKATEIIQLVRQDKKNKGNAILMALPKGIGSAVWDVEVSIELIEESLERIPVRYT